MRVTYFGYYVRENSTGKNYRVNLTDFFAGFSKWKIAAIKSKLSYNGELLFLAPLVSPSYMFIQSRDSELIKRIERKSEQVADIATVLAQDESVGMASYLLVQPYYIGLACRVLSPRIGAFASWVNQVFMHMRLDFTFEIRALTDQVTVQDVYKFDHVGAVTIDLDVGNLVAQQVLDVLTGRDPTSVANIGSLEITIRPLQGKGKRKSIKPFALKAESTIPSSGLDGFEARARREAGDQMTDIHLVGSGAIRDMVEVDDESHVPLAMQTLAGTNERLARKLKEFKADVAFPKAPSRVDNIFDWKSARAAYLGNP